MNGPPLCAGRSSRTGEPCKKQSMKGMTVCRTHGGSITRVREAATKRLAFAELLRQTEQEAEHDPSMRDPHATLLLTVQRAAVVERATWLALREIEQDTTTLGAAAGFREVDTVGVERWERAVKRLADVSALAIKAGIEERQVKLAESVGNEFVRILGVVMSRIGVTPEQRNHASRIAVEELTRLAAA